MNYLKLFRDSWRLFRSTKLISVFGCLFLLLILPIPLFQPVRDNPVLVCVYFPIATVSICIATLSAGSMYFAIHQASLSQKMTFSQVWSQGKLKLLRNFGLIVLSIPFLLIGAFFLGLTITRIPTSPFLWLIILVGTTFLSSFYTFGLCAVMIHNVKVMAAAWTSFLITINNFARVFVISGAAYLVRLLITVLVVAILASGGLGIELPGSLSLDYPTYQKVAAIPIVSWINWFFNLFLFPLESVMLTLVYLQAIREVSYPALVQKPTTA